MVENERYSPENKIIYQLPALSDQEKKLNEKFLSGLKNSDKKGILTQQSENISFAFLNYKRDLENLNNFLPTTSDEPSHLFFFSKEYGTLEFVPIDKNRPINPNDLNVIVSGLALNSDNYPENSSLNLRLVSRRRKIEDKPLNVHILHLEKPINPETPIPNEENTDSLSQKIADNLTPAQEEPKPKKIITLSDLSSNTELLSPEKPVPPTPSTTPEIQKPS